MRAPPQRRHRGIPLVVPGVDVASFLVAPQPWTDIAQADVGEYIGRPLHEAKAVLASHY